MDQDVINEKLESPRRCLQRIHDKYPATAADLSQDQDAQDIVSLNLTRAVQICVDLRPTSSPLGNCQHRIPWARLSIRLPMPRSYPLNLPSG